eukprot:219774_1
MSTKARKLKLTGSDIDNILDEVESKEAKKPQETKDNEEATNFVRIIKDNPWLPNDAFINNWLGKMLSEATDAEKKLARKELREIEEKERPSVSDLHFFGQHPIISKLRIAFENNPPMRQLASGMVSEVVLAHPKSPIRKVRELLLILNHVLGVAPTYNDDPNKINTLPLASAFGRYASTKSGIQLFSRSDITQIFSQYLDSWSKFLDSEASTYVLTEKPNGWMVNENAIELMQMEDYVIPKGGFKSWNSYFSRSVLASARPISQPKNDAIIVSPIDGVIYNIAHNVQEYSEFWIKRQPYSLRALLNNDDEMIA